MRKVNLKILAITLIISMFTGILLSPDAIAAKKKKKLSEEEMTQLTTTVSSLVRKVYSAALFSPKDNQKLVDIKSQLDDAMMGSPNPDFAPLYFKVGYVYEKREYKDEAIECFQTVLDNFPDTPYAAKSMNELKKMGVKIIAPSASGGTQ